MRLCRRRSPRSLVGLLNRIKVSSVTTVEWRKPHSGAKSLIKRMLITGVFLLNSWADNSNACGLYYKSNGHFRALEGESRVIRAKKARKAGDLHVSHQFRAGPVTANRNITCANCGTNNTVLWRKGPDGQSPLCNPCGLFYKLHGTHRSPEKRKEIHRRNRAGKKRFSISTTHTWSSAEDGDDENESPITPITPEFPFRHHQSQPQSFVKTEDGDFSSAHQLTEYMPPPQYQYQWQSHSVQGRC